MPAGLAKFLWLRKISKVTILDIVLLALVLGAVYAGLHQDRYFEVKGNDIIGASATFHTLQKRGWCLDAEVGGYLPAGELSAIKGQVIDGTRAKLYIYDGSRVWVAGSEESALTLRVLPEEMIPADIVPLTITMRTRRCKSTFEDWNVSTLYEASNLGGFISFYGVGGAEHLTDAEVLWLSRKISREASGDVFVDKEGDVLTVYARNIQAADTYIIRNSLGELSLSGVTVKRFK